MVSVGFYLENKDIEGVDLRHPEKGNPGCGGTEFLLAALPYYLSRHHPQCTPILFANRIEQLPDGIALHQVDHLPAAIRAAKAQGCDIFIYRPRRSPMPEALSLIDALQLPSIAWMHVTPEAATLRALARTRFIRAAVCVGHEQYDLLQDCPLNDRLTYINNGLDDAALKTTPAPCKDDKLVAYLGALVPQKGFHILARCWPDILRRVPHARLAVIGSGTLYQQDRPLGRLGLAEARYEDHYIAPYLTDAQGNILPSVTFHGTLGAEKNDLLRRALIGVVNPSGQTEACPLSPLEFQACGTPVVSGAYYGLLDTVDHGRSGLLGRGDDDLIAHICQLLQNPTQARAMGENGPSYVRRHHDYTHITREWIELFSRLQAGKTPARRRFKSNLHRHYKFAVFLNRPLQRGLGSVLPWPFVAEVKEKLYPALTKRRKA